jgi:D-alanine--poly(phosphoribitol) ligase subunit 1
MAKEIFQHQNMYTKTSDLFQILKVNCQKNADKLALRTLYAGITYGQLDELSDNFAAYLIDTLPPEKSKTPIAIVGHKEPEMLVGFLGALKSGHAYVPIDDLLPQDRVAKIVSIAETPEPFTTQQIKNISAVKRNKNYGLAYAVTGDDPFYVLFTSGSTGEPKGVVITYNCVQSFLEWVINEQGFDKEKNVYLNQAPFTFDLSVQDLFGSLVTEGTVYAITRNELANPKLLYQALAESEATSWFSTPSFAQLCLMDKSFTNQMLPKLKKFLFCGEPLSVETVRMLFDRFPDVAVWNTYGPTETTVAVTSVKITPETLDKYKSLPLGYPKPDDDIYIQDDEIIISGDNVGPGYLKRPEQTAKAFFKHNGMQAYHTGDTGYIEDGMVFFVGRKDNQIKLHGHRIELGDIENNLKRIPNVKDAIVVVKKPAEGGDAFDYLVAFVLYNSDEPNAEVIPTIKKQLTEKVPVYMVPKKFILMAKFPMNTNGKADRKKLAEELNK